MNRRAERAFRNALGEMKHHRKDTFERSEEPLADMSRIEQNAMVFADGMWDMFGINMGDPYAAHIAYATMHWVMGQVDGVEHHVVEHHTEIDVNLARIMAVVEAGNAVAEAVYMKHGANAPDYCANCGEGADAPPPDNP